MKEAEAEEGVREAGKRESGLMVEVEVPARAILVWLRFACTIFAANVCGISMGPMQSNSKNVQATHRLR